MHFGKRLERDLVERWRPHYLQYKLLKKQIKEIEQHEEAGHDVKDDAANGLLVNQQINYQEFSFPGPRAHRYSQLSAFKPVLDKEVQKINDFTTSKVKEIQNRILQLLRTSAPWKGIKGKPNAEELKEFEEFLASETKEADTIAQELVDIDKFIRQNCIAIQKIIKKFDKRLHFDVAPWLNAQLMENEPFLKVNLDAILIALSDVFELLSNIRAELKALQDIEVKDEHKKGISAQSFERKTTKYWVKAENLMKVKVAILKNLPAYLFDRKIDGQDSVRSKNFLRDFNELYGAMGDSSAITSIYMDNSDLDIYHTRLSREEGAQLFRLRWYGDAKSLPTKDYVFLERKTHHESWVEAKSVKERFPMKTKNVQAFIEGKFNPADTMHKWMKPDSKGFKLIKDQKELDKASELAVECLEAFQKRKLKPMVRTIYHRTAFQSREHNEVRISIDKQLMMVNENVIPEKDNEFPWCRDMIHHHIPPSDILQFPYCILEVKLNCENPPTWISDLLADTTTIIECPKFSKFLTGVAYHQYDKVKELPYWFKDQVAIDPRNRFMSNEEKEKLIYQDTKQQFEGEVDSDDDISPKAKKPKKEVAEMPDHHAIDVADEKTPLIAKGESSKAKVQFVETPSSSSGGLFSAIRKRLTGRGSEEGRKPLKPVRSSNRIKIEPKTSFANERTLIQWVSAASLMITLATLIMTSGSEMGFKAGFVFFPLAFVIMFYAIIRYQYRAWSFRHRRNQFMDDLYGPVFLVISIASAMGVIMYLMFSSNADVPRVQPVVNSAEGCEFLNATGLPSYFPYGDIALHSGSLIAVAPYSVAVLGEDDKWGLKRLPNVPVASVASKDTAKVYLGVEGSHPGVYLYDVSKQELGTFMSLNETNFSFKALEQVEPNILLISDVHGALYKVNVSANSLAIIDVIPSTRITVGLIDDDYYKQVSGLFYSESDQKLFVLLGHSRLIRVFNWPDLSLVNEWTLPGTSFQWSGLSIADTKDGKRLLLSQSVPSSLWQFKLTPEAVVYKSDPLKAFPACARVYQSDFTDLIQKPNNDKFQRARPRLVTEDF